jgi:hypothetical protein
VFHLKIKDRIILGSMAGLIGNLAKTFIDEISLRKKISQRSFRSTAAGVWVNNKNEATNLNGQLLGGLFDFGIGALGGIVMTHIFSKTGKDHVVTKGILSGISIGSTITALLSAFPNNKVRPKDASSNLSYMFAHSVYGVVSSVIITKFGDSSLFDANPLNDYLPPTEPTYQEEKHK